MNNELNDFFEVDIANLNPTNKLYYFNPYMVEASSNIVAILKDKDFYKIVLDETIFYPEGGGQPSDRGEIEEIPVFDVKEKDGIIYHFVNELPKSSKVKCKIDFHRRFDFMQQHSGEHALSGVILKLFGGANKGFHIGEQFVTIDINIKDMTVTKIVVSPNPVKNILYIKSTSDYKKLSVEIYDMQGRLIVNHILNDKKEVNVSNLVKGTYIIKIKDFDKLILQSKIIKN